MDINYLNFNQAAEEAKALHPNWLAVDNDMHIRAFINKPSINIQLGHWLSENRSWDLGFYKGCIA